MRILVVILFGVLLAISASIYAGKAKGGKGDCGTCSDTIPSKVVGK